MTWRAATELILILSLIGLFVGVVMARARWRWLVCAYLPVFLALVVLRQHFHILHRPYAGERFQVIVPGRYEMTSRAGGLRMDEIFASGQVVDVRGGRMRLVEDGGRFASFFVRPVVAVPFQE